MNKSHRIILALVLLWSLIISTPITTADIIGLGFGDAPPPSMLGPYTLTPFGSDPQLPGDVTSVVSPLGGSVDFSVTLNGFVTTWGNGYTGNMYETSEPLPQKVRLTLPTETVTFFFYAGPDPYESFDITASAQDGTSVTQNVSGYSVAGYGFYATEGQVLSWINVDSWMDVGVGMFAIATNVSPALPDLIGEFGRIQLKAPVSPGETIRAQIIVTNIGSAATEFKQVIDIGLYLRPCDAIDESQDILVTILANLSVSNLKPGRSKKLNVSLNAPEIDYGDYKFVAQIDTEDTVEELDEDNNIAVSNTCFELVTGQSRFVETDYIELSKIYCISKFRSGIGHDYSDDFEFCRSMKHYYQPKDSVNWGDVKIYSPVDGVISRKFEEWAGTQIWIQSSAHPEFEFIIFHINLNPAINIDSTVSAGQQLGTHIGSQTMSDIAVSMSTPEGTRLVSYFDVMSDSLFQNYQLRGLTSRDEVIISEAERDLDPLTCNGEEFLNSGNLENWAILSD